MTENRIYEEKMKVRMIRCRAVMCRGAQDYKKYGLVQCAKRVRNTYTKV